MSPSSRAADVDASIRRQPLDALQRAAKEAGHKLVNEHFACQIGPGFAVASAPIVRTEIPTEKELTKGVDLLYSYLSVPDAKKLKAGFYLVRIATRGFNFQDGTVKISFVDSQGKTAYSFQGKAQPLGKGKEVPSSDDLLAGGVPRGQVCGRNKCFHWKWLGGLKWELGCTDKDTG